MNAALRLGWITPGTMEGCAPPSPGQRLGQWAVRYFPAVEQDAWLAARNPWRESRDADAIGYAKAACAEAQEPDYYDDCIDYG